MRMKSVGQLLAALVLIAGLVSCSNSNITGLPTTGFMWVATEGNQQISAFQIDLSNGNITAIGTNRPTGVQPSAMAITPNGKALFIANTTDNTISAYAVNSDNTLQAPQSGSGTCPAAACTVVQGPNGMNLGLNPVAMAVDPSGTFLFVAEQGQPNNTNAPGGISVFSISGTSLTLTGATCPAGFSQTNCPFVTVDPSTGFSTGPSAVLAAPSGKFLYLANALTNTVESFSYDATGNLQALNLSASNPIGFPTGNTPSALAFSRCAGFTKPTTYCLSGDSNTLFVANAGSNTLSVFTSCIQISATCANPDGNLVAVSGSPIAADVGPVAIMIDPAIGFVYAINAQSNTVSQYRYSPVTGKLSTLSPPAVASGISPFSGGVTSDGNHAVVSNNNGSSISVYDINPGGHLLPSATSSITLAGQPSAILIR